MPIYATETQVPGYKRSGRSSGCSSPVDSLDAEAASRREAKRMQIWTAMTGKPGTPRRSGQSTRNSSSAVAAAASPPRPHPTASPPRPHPTWVILNRAGARSDYFCGDHTTSVISHTSAGKKVSVSFELVEPPGTSVLTLDWPQGPASMYPQVVAADRNVVLFEMPCGKDCPADFVDYFIYEASSDPSRPSSLSLLPVLYSKRDSNEGRPMHHIMNMEATGVLCVGHGLFIVAELQTRRDSVDIYLLVSGSDKGKWWYEEWKVLKRLPVRCANGDRLDLSLWSTDKVLPYRHRLIFVDYYRGIILINFKHPWRTPNLEYVPLPTDAAGVCDDWNYGRRCPEAYHNIFVTRSAIKFVTINQQHSSSSGVALHQCGSTFRITTWSCDYADRWIEEATLDAEELWGLDSENRFPHVVPEFPVFNMENPDIICFSLNEDSYTFGYNGNTWMIEVHIKKKLLLKATAYSKDQSLSGQITTKSARILSQGFSFIACEMPYYLCEKRRKVRKQEYN